MLKQGGGGAIVNMASVAGMMGLAGAATYSASKHGVIGSQVRRAGNGAKRNSRKRGVPCGDRTPMADRALKIRESRVVQVCIPSAFWKGGRNPESGALEWLGHASFRPASRWFSMRLAGGSNLPAGII